MELSSNFRPLDPRELGLIEKLLESDFAGRDELRLQLRSTKAKELDAGGTLGLRCDSDIPAPTKYALVSEGLCPDEDGLNIGVLLHVDRNGFLSMLEIVKYGGDTILRPPTADKLVVL